MIWARCRTGAASSGTAHGFSSNSNGTIFSHCVAVGAGGQGFAGGNGNLTNFDHCVAYNNVSHGFSIGADNFLESCIAEANGSSGTVYGFETTGTETGQRLVNCAGYNNRTANYDSAKFWSYQVVNFQALSGSPFTNASGGDFTLNNTAGAGASCRGVSVTIPGISTTSYPDIGVAQHTDPAAAAPSWFEG
jgi:hypothetical protein